MKKKAEWMIKRAIACLLTVVLAVGCLPFFERGSLAEGSGQGLTPNVLHYSNGQLLTNGSTGDVALSKTAERIGPDEWKVTVQAEIERDVLRPRQKLELVILLDTSGSMAWCTNQDEHDLGDHTSHGNSCYRAGCGWVNHDHTEDCYICNKEEHSHTNCEKTLICTKEIHEHNYPTCDFSYSSGWKCGKEEHKAHTSSCYTYLCNKEVHTHSDACALQLVCTRQLIDHATSGGSRCQYAETGDKLNSRLSVAQDKLIALIENLKNENKGYDITIRFCSFSDSFKSPSHTQALNSIKSSINSVRADGGTNMYTSIPSAINNFATGSDTKKVFLLMTDGQADDDGEANVNNAKSKIKTFIDNGGTVFTIGFAYDNNDLAALAGGGGSYVHAGSELDLERALLNIETIIQAMMVDPMGKKVGFDAGSINIHETNTKGTVSYVGDTLFWNPTDDSVPAGAKIKYSYTVKLNSLADMTVGTHSRVELNDPTDLIYSLTSNGQITQYSVGFPIPEATYEVATLKQRWVDEEGNKIKNDSEEESIISDYSDASYLPAFETDYENPVKSLTKKGFISTKKYVYSHSTVTVTKDGQTSSGTVNPSVAAAYVVTHHYTEANNPYTVSYQYTGNVPADAPAAGSFDHLAEKNSVVNVAANPTADGFVFNGWTVKSGINEDISDGSFTMPGNNVVLQGSWTKLRGYRVQANYFVNVNGVKTEQENLQVVDLGFVTTADTVASYDFSSAYSYNGKQYDTVTLVKAEGDTTSINGSKVEGIQPGLDTTPIVTLHFYRQENRKYSLFVKHIFDDQSVHTGYSSEYVPYGHPYEFNQEWSVESDVPRGYVRVLATSGVTKGDANDTFLEQGQGVLSGSEFGNGDKYVVIHYAKAPCYIVQTDYYLVEDGVATKENGDTPVELAFVTCDLDATTATYTIKDTDSKYTVGGQVQTYTKVQQAEGSAGTLSESGSEVTSIIPAMDDYPVVHLTFYRYVTTPVQYQVIHQYYVVDPDGVAGDYIAEEKVESEILTDDHGKTVAPQQDESGQTPDIVVEKNTAGNKKTHTYTYVGSDPESITLDKASAEMQTITLKYERYQQRVSIDGDAGVIIKKGVSADNGGEVYDRGVNASVQYEIKPEYKLVSVTVNGVPVAEDQLPADGMLTFENLQQNKAVVVTTARKNSYTVTIQYVSEDTDKAILTYNDYVSDAALEGTTYDVSGQLLAPITDEDGNIWCYSGERLLTGDAVSGTLDQDKKITAKYYRKPTYTITATYTTVTDGDRTSEEQGVAKTTGEVGAMIPFAQSEYDSKVEGFTSGHFQNDLKVNGTAVDTMPKMEKFGEYAVTLSYEKVIHSDAFYQVQHEYYYVDPDGKETRAADDCYTSESVAGKHGDTVNASDIAADVNGKTDTVEYKVVSRAPESITLDKNSADIQTITLKYERYQQRVSVDGDEGVTIKSGVSAADGGEVYDRGVNASVQYEIKPEYKLISVTVNGVPVAEDQLPADGMLTFENLQQNKAVVVTTARKNSYTVTIQYVSEDTDKAILTYNDYVSDAALEGTTYDVSGQLLSTITDEDGNIWCYSGERLLTGDAVSGTLDQDKKITAKYYRKPTYTITATYTTVTDGDRTSEEQGVAKTTGEVDAMIPFAQSEYDSKVEGFTSGHFQNDLMVNGTPADTMPKMEKFGEYAVTLSYEKVIHSDAFYQVQHEYYHVDPDGKETRAADDCYTSESVAGKHGDTVNASDIAADVNGKTDTVEYKVVSRAPESITLDKASAEMQTITLKYERYQQRVSVDGDEGVTIKSGVSADNGGEVYDRGVNASVQYEIKPEYKLVSVTVNGVPVAEDQLPADGMLTFENLQQNKAVVVTTARKNSYTVTIQYVSEDTDKAILTYNDYVSDAALEGTTYDVSGQLLAPITDEDGNIWCYSGERLLTGDAVSGILDQDKKITAKYYRKPTYTITATYTTVTDGDRTSEEQGVAKTTGEVDAMIPFAQSEYDSKVEGFTSGHFQNDLMVNGTPADTMPKMEKFGEYAVTLSYEKVIHSDAFYQVQHEYYHVDPDGKETRAADDCYTSESVAGKHGDTVNASDIAADVNGKTDTVEYKVVSRAPESITLDKNSLKTITITYERYQAPITVHYVDSQGASMKEDYTDTLYAGDAYDLNTEDVQISEILKDGVPYDFAYDSTDTAYSGILTRDGVEITRVYLERGKAFASVQYVDENGNPLQMPLITDEMYIGDPYDVTEALQVEQIILGGSEYAFDHHYQMRAPVRSVGSLTFVEDVDYSGAMPAGGIEITRVYRLDKVTYYYQQKNVYTAYDADGNVLYSATDEQPVTASQESGVTIALPESCEHSGYGFWRVSEETMTADLTDTAPDKPYVFVAYYEFRQGDEPVPDTQLPPGITVPEEPQPTVTAPVESLPPQTGDEGVALWQWLMVLAGAGLALLLAAQRKVRREEP